VGWTLALYLGWTIVLLPYAAWGAELSGDYNERSRIVGAREACIVAGTVLAAALPGALPLVLDDVSGDARAESLAAIAWFCLFALPLTVGTALLFVPEPAPAAVGRVALMPGLRLIAANAPFRRLLIAYLLNGTANGMTATLFLLFVSHVLQLPDQAGYLLLAYFVSGIVSVPIWVAVSYRLGKAPAWAVGLALTSLLFVAVPFLGPGDVWPFLAVCIATGLCLGADLALPGSMQADVVDLDTLQAGSQRTGLFFALWGMATKLALALAVGVAFPVLDLVGFDARAVTDDARASNPTRSSDQPAQHRDAGVELPAGVPMVDVLDHPPRGIEAHLAHAFDHPGRALEPPRPEATLPTVVPSATDRLRPVAEVEGQALGVREAGAQHRDHLVDADDVVERVGEAHVRRRQIAQTLHGRRRQLLPIALIAGCRVAVHGDGLEIAGSSPAMTNFLLLSNASSCPGLTRAFW
jgi:hypothetical protein